MLKHYNKLSLHGNDVLIVRWQVNKSASSYIHVHAHVSLDSWPNLTFFQREPIVWSILSKYTDSKKSLI